MENTHKSVEFRVPQKTSKQSLFSIFFHIGRGDMHAPPPLTPLSCFARTDLAIGRTTSKVDAMGLQFILLSTYTRR